MEEECHRCRPVEDSSVVAAERGAVDAANVSRQHFSALLYVTVVDCVLMINQTNSYSAQPGGISTLAVVG